MQRNTSIAHPTDWMSLFARMFEGLGKRFKVTFRMGEDTKAEGQIALSPVEQRILKAISQRPTRPSQLFASLISFVAVTPNETIEAVKNLHRAGFIEAEGQSFSTDENQVYAVSEAGRALLKQLERHPAAFTHSVYLSR